MKIVDTAILDVKILEPKVFGDDRGFFLESWNADTFKSAGLDINFVQDNHSFSTQGTLRGLHYQINTPQGKLVRVTRGAVFDVAVDIRRASPTFGKWVGVEISADNKRSLWVPPGFAHGFYVLTPHVDFLYKCTEVYSAIDDRGIRWDDPAIGIAWPLVNGQPPLLSGKDAVAPLLKDAESFA